MFGQPPATDNSENKTADEDGEDDTGFINLCAPSRGRQWHDLPLSQVKELARRARSHHRTLANHAMNNHAMNNITDDVKETSSATTRPRPCDRRHHQARTTRARHTGHRPHARAPAHAREGRVRERTITTLGFDLN